jgi:hypothetical protein
VSIHVTIDIIMFHVIQILTNACKDKHVIKMRIVTTHLDHLIVLAVVVIEETA